MVFFLQFYEPVDLGKKISATWNALKSEVYLTCINFWKFHDDLNACLEVIRLPSWSKNVKFSVKMHFITFLSTWRICFWINNKSEALGLCNQHFCIFQLSMRQSNGEYFKDFKIFDLVWIWWIWLEWLFGCSNFWLKGFKLLSPVWWCL